ncbi:hypothetical protein AB4Z21_31530 [Paenibacillus sp. MCAF20]
MDHGDHTSSPSARKTQLYQKRMEMISRLMNRPDEEANDEQIRLTAEVCKGKKKAGIRERLSKSIGLEKWLNVVYRMFT